MPRASGLGAIEATPDSGWYFAYWTGDLSGTDNVKQLTVSGDITATAVFVEDFTLTVLTDGDGSVSPGTASYLPGDPVVLTATADSGWRFDHWEGDFDTQDNPLNLTMYDNYTVTAVFVEDNLLTVSTIGEGTVTLSPTQPPTGYAPSTVVTLTALPASGWLFEGWSGALSGSVNPESITTPVASEIVAEFREAQTLTITIEGNGGAGSVAVSDAHRTYPAGPGGTYTVPLGAELTLTPTATSGCFYQWTGDLTGSSSPGTLTVAGDHAVTAEFGMRSPVELSVQGEGSITLDPPQPPEGYCPGTEVTVTAVPDADWVFTEWAAGLPNLEWAPSQTFIPTPGPVDISAFFVYRPGIASLTMVEDLGAYLVAIGVYTDPEEVENFDYDTGVEELDGLVTVHLPNGIPDAAELMALQAVLQNPGIETKDSGVSHMALWKIYLTNLAQAQIDLSAQSPAVQRAVAAYMTLGSFGHVGQVLVDVQTHFGVTLDRFLYPNAGDRWFAADKDMDRDGVTNKQEWDYAVAQTAEAKTGTLGAVAAYVESVPDPGEGGTAPPSLPDTGELADFASACPGPMGRVEVLNSPVLTVTARVTIPDGTKTFLLNEGDAALLPVGVEVQVEASEAAWFRSWYAPDSLLDGSDQPSDSFILTGETEIRAGLKSTWVVEHPDNSYQRVNLSVAGGDEPFVVARGVGRLSDRYIAVREGTLLLAEASQRGPLEPWVKLELARRNAVYAGRKARIYPADVRVALPMSGGAPHGIATVSASGANTLPTVNWNSGTKLEPFVRYNKYAIPKGPGVTWERSMGATFYPEACYYIYNTSNPKATNLNPNPTAEATASAMNVLTLKPGECEDGCGMDQHGFVWLDNAKRYYIGPTAARSNAELVGVSGSAAPGHVLKGLKIEGGGQVWRWDGQGHVEDFTSLDDMFPVTPDADGLYVGDDLYVEMKTDATVTPVVVTGIAKLTVYVDDPTPDSSFPHPFTGDDKYGHVFWMFEAECVPTELQNYVNKKWGFYPLYTWAVAVPIPTIPPWSMWVNTPGDLMSDEGHPSTHSRTYEITLVEALAGLAYTKSLYEGTHSDPITIDYHVENFNCAAAAIEAASAAGVTLPNAQGFCIDVGHSFSGPCPGALGERLGS